MDFTSAGFWAALGSIVLANLLLSGDNAVVIALAARSLPRHQQRRAIAFGSAAAIALRVGLTIGAVQLLKQPYLKIAGGLLLFYLGITLQADGGGEGGATGWPAARGMIAAIRTILVADLVMSLDNVIAVAAAAGGDILLLSLGLVISIPLIVFGSTLLLRMMERLPVVITAGAALLGWLAGEMLLTDPAIDRAFGALADSVVSVAGIVGAVLVVAVGLFLQQRSRAGD
jgi:YjbE family integral membrane protein